MSLKLTYEQHLDILKRFENDEFQKDIAKIYGVHQTTISKYLHRKPRLYQDTGNFNLNHEFFKVINTREKAYWLGFLLADGNICNNVISLQLSKKDLDHLKLFQKTFLAEKYKIQFRKTQDTCVISFKSKYLANDLISHGVTPRKSLTAEFPVGVPDELISAVIRGIFDGDGHVTICNNRPQYGFTGTYKLLNSIQKFLNVNTKISKRKNANCYQFVCNKEENFMKFYNYIYKDATTHLSRKKQRFDELIKEKYAKQTKIICMV